jgi:hypothetical protein
MSGVGVAEFRYEASGRRQGATDDRVKVDLTVVVECKALNEMRGFLCFLCYGDSAICYGDSALSSPRKLNALSP